MKQFFQYIVILLKYPAYNLFSRLYSLDSKIKELKYIGLFLLLVANSLPTHAQLFPVQVNQSIIPPYNTKLNSYATSTDVKLRLFLTLTDINVSNRQVRLKLKIQGQGLNIQSTDFVTGAPQIFLNGGAQQQFTNIDLAHYFQLNNLLGINPQQYNQPLPDGTYRICWEVYDFLTNQRISNPNMGCSNIFLLLNDPPFLNLPNRGDQLTDIQPTNIIFQWTPRHANATNVNYEFELREIWDEQIDPQAGFLVSPPFHTETTFATTLLYNISKLPLIPGRTYAWRVRAISTTGLSENSVFRNNGYSEVFYFTYTNQCFPPTYALAEPLNTGRVKISWQTHPDHNKYNVQYKRADVEDAEWFEITSYNNQVQIANLQDGVTYNFRVGGTCHDLTDFNQAFIYSSINQFTMPTAYETVSYSCGIVPEIDVTNTTPLSNLGINETFTAGDFPVTVKQIEGGNGVFSGTGFIVVPYLADTKIAVEFSGIKINTEYQLYDGIIKTTYDLTWSGVESVDDIIADIFGNNDTNDTSDNDGTDDTVGNNGNDTDESPNDQNTESDTATNINDTTNDNSTNNGSSTNNDTTNTSNTSNGSDNTENSNNNSNNTDNNATSTDDTEVLIVHNNKSYRNEDVIEVEYKSDQPHFAFLIKNYPKDATFNWQVLRSGTDNTAVHATNETTHDNFGIDMKQFHILDIVANYNDKKIQVTIKRKAKEFKFIELYALHSQKRLAKSGEILYLINPPSKASIEYGLKIDSELNEDLMSPNSIQWSYDGEEQYFSRAKTNVTRSLEESDNIITTSVTAGNPNAIEKSVDVKWVDEKFEKYKLSLGSDNPLIKKAFEATKLVEKYGKKLEKLSFIKSTDTSSPVGITWYYNIVPFESIESNIEDENSRLYYRNRTIKGGFDVGIKGKVVIWTWGLPFDKFPIPDWAKEKIKDYITAKVDIVAKADASGKLRVVSVDKKWVESNEWKEVSKSVNPAVIALTASFGAEGEFSLLKENEWFGISGYATGTAGTELLSIGYANNEFGIFPLREGVYIDLTAGAYLNFLGKKLETTPYYKRIQLIKPLNKQDE